MPIWAIAILLLTVCCIGVPLGVKERGGDIFYGLNKLIAVVFSAVVWLIGTLLVLAIQGCVGWR